MTTPEVKLNQELARIAEDVAASRGERLEDVVDRLIRAYVGEDGSYHRSADTGSGTSGDKTDS